jgi:hypothetical protein
MQTRQSIDEQLEQIRIEISIHIRKLYTLELMEKSLKEQLKHAPQGEQK